MKLHTIPTYILLMLAVSGCVSKGYVLSTNADIEVTRHMASKHIVKITHDNRYKPGSLIYPMFGKLISSESEVYSRVTIAKPDYDSFYPSVIDFFDQDIPTERNNRLTSVVGFVYPCDNKERSVVMIYGKDPSGKWYQQSVDSPKVLNYRTYKEAVRYTINPVMQ